MIKLHDGGPHFILAYESKDLGRAPTEKELEAARTIIETRMDA